MADQWFQRGHVAIVTGGSKGLGKATARALLERGLHVIIDARESRALEEARAELGALGRLVAIQGDVADPDHVHELVRTADEQFGRLDLLVNNASTLGATPLPRIDELSQPAFTRLFLTNVFAPIHLIQHALPLMRRSGEITTIVNVTSDAGVEAYPTWGGYGSSKAALEHVSRVLAAELHTLDVRLLVVDPGDMNTNMHREAVPGADPNGLGDPQHVAHALLDAIAHAHLPYERVALLAVAPV